MHTCKFVYSVCRYLTVVYSILYIYIQTNHPSIPPNPIHLNALSLYTFHFYFFSSRKDDDPKRPNYLPLAPLFRRNESNRIGSDQMGGYLKQRLSNAALGYTGCDVCNIYIK
ncbi:hypothetical protein F4779DRAFT_440578 [Xylariaceae sp. FL0662B]|nr:hypothetical protein F4779DRAFT_440578 [Xylariaceae sp. FL0662B]